MQLLVHEYKGVYEKTNNKNKKKQEMGKQYLIFSHLFPSKNRWVEKKKYT